MHGRLLIVAATLVLAIAAAAPAQPKIDNILTGKPLTGQVGSDRESPETVVSVSSSFMAAGGKGTLSVTAKIKPQWHVYSLTQKPVQAVPTTISVAPSQDYRIAGDFRPNLPPQVVKKDGAVFEEHSGEVTWQAPIELAAGVDPRNLKISGEARIQSCNEGSCLAPHAFDFTASLAEAAAPTAVGKLIDSNDHVTLIGSLEPQAVAPGGKAKVVIEAQPGEGWHIYELAAVDSDALGYKPTLIALTNTSGLPYSRTVASEKAVVGEALVPGDPPQKVPREPCRLDHHDRRAQERQTGQLQDRRTDRLPGVYGAELRLPARSTLRGNTRRYE
jgi:hypothetical protein